MCAFDVWLHDETTYTYHGDAPITGLTHTELDKLQFGHIVREEQKADAYESSDPTGQRRRESKKATAHRNMKQYHRNQFAEAN